MGLGADFLNILKDSVKLTDAVERLNGAVSELKNDVHDIDKRVVRIETMIEISQSQKKINKD
jgi:hypothetical protein